MSAFKGHSFRIGAASAAALHKVGCSDKGTWDQMPLENIFVCHRESSYWPVWVCRWGGHMSVLAGEMTPPMEYSRFYLL